MKTIFLSDIHIGIDAPTNLYQSSTDQANLKRILSYIQNNKVKDLVILGDWIDLWMYGTTVVPPTVQQIIAANPQIFTKQSDGSGDFVSCLDNIQGTIHYVNGNHDINVTENDINGYFSTVSKKQVNCIDCSRGPKGYSSGKVFGEHGHWYSMVCRPYKKEPLPIGYFITRIGMQAMINKKRPLPPLDVIGIQELISYTGMTFAQAILTNLANQGGYNKLSDVVFTMPDSSTINGEAVADKFPELSINEMDFLRTDDGGSLDVNASILNEKHEVVILGHTHIKELKEDKRFFRKAIYANSGFLCANEPNLNGIPMTTFVEVEDNTISMIKVDYKTGKFTVDKKLTY